MMTIVPVIVGTVVIVALNQPTPMGSPFPGARIAEGAFWIAAAIGMLLSKRQPGAGPGPLAVRPADAVAAVAVVVLVRVMARGIPIG